MKYRSIMFWVLLSTFLWCKLPSLHAQEIDTFSIIHDVAAEEYFRINVENDFFSQSDDDYTHGINLEWIHPVFEKNPANYLFFKGENGKHRYGIAIEQAWFTPEEITAQDIIFGDHPYSGVFYIKSSMVGDYVAKRFRVKSSFLLGIIGPAAQGEAMQRFAHEVTNNALPEGWSNQIQNDVVLNYNIGVEKLFFAHQDNVQLYGTATGRLGTLYTDVSMGAIAAIGLLNNAFSETTNAGAFSFYGYARPRISLIGYNATLQGGVFNRKNVYTIPNDTIERVVGRLDYGVVLKISACYFEFYKVLQTQEYATGSSEGWGGIKFGLKF